MAGAHACKIKCQAQSAAAAALNSTVRRHQNISAVSCAMIYALRCRCGTIQGQVDTAQSADRALCYCKDCQAYARFLSGQLDMLNSQGGTEIIASLPRSVHFTAGKDRLACMSLSEKGLLRWYASCCNTAIGNTPRDSKMSYVGLVRTCLPGDETEMTNAFGPLKIALNTESAGGKVSSTPAATFFGVLKIIRNLIGSRLTGKHKMTPFFRPNSNEPITAPKNLTPAERQALERAA